MGIITIPPPPEGERPEPCPDCGELLTWVPAQWTLIQGSPMIPEPLAGWGCLACCASFNCMMGLDPTGKYVEGGDGEGSVNTCSECGGRVVDGKPAMELEVRPGCRLPVDWKLNG